MAVARMGSGTGRCQHTVSTSAVCNAVQARRRVGEMCASPAATSVARASNPLAQVSCTGLVSSSEAREPMVSSERRPTSPHG
eukprot:scaffold14510_cov76-Phaeocystis_antarctica.AAC.2